jgi:UDP-N-acetylmuramate dehydrogenase
MDSFGNVYEKSKPELIFDYRKANITAKFILAAKIALSKAGSENILKAIKEIWMYKKNSQPLSTKNAGCIFKNPRGISAGAVIERAGLKGLSVGGAQVSEKHANFILANKGCKSSDIENLIGVIKGRVREQSDISQDKSTNPQHGFLYFSTHYTLSVDFLSQYTSRSFLNLSLHFQTIQLHIL